jgi:NADP-dependent 3-hydroxy acid dehydrogenase YdfG
VLSLCAKNGLVKVGVIAVDGTKLPGNASRNANVDYEQLAREILEEAQAVDAAEDELYGDARGDELPEQLRTGEGRRAWLREAKRQHRLARHGTVSRVRGRGPWHRASWPRGCRGTRASSSRSVYLGDMSNGLRDTVALITGASSGIGEATARALAAQGTTVALVARRKDRLDALTAEIGGLAIETDVTDREQAQAAVERTVQELGRLDIVINNAGVMLLGPIVDAPVEEWDRMIELNLQGLLYIAHAALPHLLRAAELEPRRVADLVNVSSVAGRRVGAGGGIYQLTKHGVGTFSEALRQEVTARYVRSSLIEPGATESELVTHLREEVRSQLPAGVDKILAAEDIADAILYIVTRPRHVAINEILVRPTEQVR